MDTTQRWVHAETLVEHLRGDEPGRLVDWRRAETHLDGLARLASCPQDPQFHAEGDVAEHTRRVLTCLAAHTGGAAHAELVLAALLHDIAKPHCTRLEDGRWRAPGHARRGAIVARTLLWRLGLHPLQRERICALIGAHLRPFHLLGRTDATREAIRLSHVLDVRDLAALATADGCGRESDSATQLLDAVSMFSQWCAELGVATGPFPHDAAARVRYLMLAADDPTYSPWSSGGSRMWVMSGLPATGKDTWIARHAADATVVSLDAIRDELGVAAHEPQGKVVAEARERAKALLRRGADVVWNATNLSRSVRGNVIRLGLAYGAHVTVVAVEAPAALAAARNRARRAPVPDAAIARMLERWEAPDVTEAHELLVVDGTTGETLHHAR